MKLADATVFETPNAVMHVHAGPEATGSELAVWRAELSGRKEERRTYRRAGRRCARASRAARSRPR